MVLTGLPRWHPSHPRGQESQRVEGEYLFEMSDKIIEEHWESGLWDGDETGKDVVFFDKVGVEPSDSVEMSGL